MLVYLRTSMEYIQANYTNYGIILLGDFNKLDFKRDAKCFQLKPIVKFPTRGSNTLDQISLTCRNTIVHRLLALFLVCQTI